MGSKNPKIIVDDQDFILAEKRVEKTTWRCCRYYYSMTERCKVKLITAKRTVQVIGEHNHPIKPRTDQKNMIPQNVTIVRKKC
ncbi:unnamed protein product [Diabrotica balteata]|uniref:FLYWCH-type domain-containing protein n=1 Tax=Diabrotica balteata TaxID=107213 RepID=A0A9N9SZG8_DIABA|nr:unnamed protein product [Diabrotica balteata]